MLDRSLHLLQRLSGIDGDKVGSILGASHFGKKLADAVLELLLLVALLTKPTTLRSVLGRYVKE